MPFDAGIAVPQVTDKLAALGIVPVSLALLEQHKERMLLNGFSGSKWLSVDLWRDTLTADLSRPYRLAGLPWVSGAPKRVRRIAALVRDAIPEAHFKLGYFYLDPYLMVHYDRKSACLAIWYNRFRLVAIAKRS